MPTNAINDTGVKYVYDKLNAKKVDKETGKGLSTNDYSNADKSKVSKIDETTSSKSGNPISISGLKANQLAVNPIITLEPIQDLHGQSKPYPAGGGKNKFNIGWVYTTSIFSVSGQKITKTTSAYNADLFSGNTGQARPSAQKLYLEAGTYTLSYTSTESTNIFVDSIDSSTLVPNGGIAKSCPSGTGTSFTVSTASWVCLKVTASSALTISNLQIESGSSATPYAPYENICPISGYDKVEALSCGKNLFDISKVLMGTVSGNAWTITVNSSILGLKVYDLKFKENTSYTFSGTEQQNAANKNCRLRVVYTDGTTADVFSDTATTAKAFRFVSNASKTISYITATYSSADNVTITNLQIEEGNIESPVYVPYVKATSISESLGQMVYGGTLDVRTGVLTVTHGIVDLGDLTYTYNAGGTGEFGASLPLSKQVSTASNPNAVCSIYAVRESGYRNANNFTIGVADKSYSTSPYITIKDNRYNSSSDLKTALTGQKLVYELATPFEIQLTPHEISLLKDYAYVSTNGTSIALDYHNGELASLGDVVQLSETVENGFDFVKQLTATSGTGYVITQMMSLIFINFNSFTGNKLPIKPANAYWGVTQFYDTTSKQTCHANIQTNGNISFSGEDDVALNSYHIYGTCVLVGKITP